MIFLKNLPFIFFISIWSKAIKSSNFENYAALRCAATCCQFLFDKSSTNKTERKRSVTSFLKVSSPFGVRKLCGDCGSVCKC